MKPTSLFSATALAVLLFAGVAPRSSRASLYQIDDGTAENTFGVIDFNYDLIALNQFTVIGGNNMIGSVEIAFGSPFSNDTSLNGLPYTVVVWDDPNNDGDPSDASYVISAQNVVSSANTNTLELTTLPICVPVSQSFFVGFLINAGDNHLGGFQEPAAVDVNSFLPNRSYITAAPGGAGDIYNLSNNYLLPLGTYEYNSGKAGNFIIRANPWQVPEPATTTLIIFAGFAGIIGFRPRRAHANARRKTIRMEQDHEAK